MKILNLKNTNKCKSHFLNGVVSLGICLFLLGTFGCGNNNTDNNSVDSAMNVNDQKLGDSTNGMAISSSDADFVVKAANGGMAEVQLGKIAKDKATNEKVKEFAAKMIKDHTKINDRLKSIAGDLNLTLPATIDQEKQDDVDKLNTISVKDFDKTYVDMMVKAHDTDVDAFQKASKDVSNSDLHGFIMESLPVLQSHQKMIKQIDDNMK